MSLFWYLRKSFGLHFWRTILVNIEFSFERLGFLFVFFFCFHWNAQYDSHGLLVSIISAEKSVINYIRVTLLVKNNFSLATVNAYFLSLTFTDLFYDMNVWDFFVLTSCKFTEPRLPRIIYCFVINLWSTHLIVSWIFSLLSFSLSLPPDSLLCRYYCISGVLHFLKFFPVLSYP